MDIVVAWVKLHLILECLCCVPTPLSLQLPANVHPGGWTVHLGPCRQRETQMDLLAPGPALTIASIWE